MNIREDLLRYLNETNKVIQTRRYKWLCAILVVLSLVSVFHVFQPEYWQMRRMRRHIEAISPQWEAFKRANPGFESVELFPRYDEARGVRFAAKGRAPWSVDLNQLAEFMSNTKPPFPVDISKVEGRYGMAEKKTISMPDGREIKLEELEVLLERRHGSDFTTTRSITEPGGPANGSQPIPSETNSTSSPPMNNSR